MKKCAIITLVFIIVLTGGCKIKSDFIDPYVTRESVVLIPNDLIDFQKISETIVETIVEITTIIHSTHLSETATVPSTVPPTTKSAEEIDSEILRIINEVRCVNELNPLKMNDELCVVAEIRAEEASVLWSHTRPDGTMVDTIANEMNIEWHFIGENLAKHSNAGAKCITDAWLNSPSHRKNILNSKFSKCGLSEFECDGVICVAMIFSD